MSDVTVPRSSGEIRARFVDRLNLALLRPGMFGGEMALHAFIGDLAWIDRREEDVAVTMNSWGTWSPAGVGGWLARLFGDSPQRHADAVALTYADLAHQWGYLRLQRALGAQELTRLLGEVREWTAVADRVQADVTDAFGPPSFGRAGFNPRYPVSLAYASASVSDPLVIFDFWQDTDWDSRPPVLRLGPAPVLRDVRWRESGSFSFTFTPAGESLCAGR